MNTGRTPDNISITAYTEIGFGCRNCASECGLGISGLAAAAAIKHVQNMPGDLTVPYSARETVSVEVDGHSVSEKLESDTTFNEQRVAGGQCDTSCAIEDAVVATALMAEVVLRRQGMQTERLAYGD